MLGSRTVTWLKTYAYVTCNMQYVGRMVVGAVYMDHGGDSVNMGSLADLMEIYHLV